MALAAITLEVVSQAEALALPQQKTVSEALLDLPSTKDLNVWLQQNL